MWVATPQPIIAPKCSFSHQRADIGGFARRSSICTPVIAPTALKPMSNACDIFRPTANTMAAPTPRNILARAGFFIRPLAESLVLLRRHAASELGSPPSEEEIARSLNSTFITSELKNQIVHARKLAAAPDASSDAADLFPG